MTIKEIELLLSRPISRFEFLLYYYIGFMLLALAILLPFCFIMGLFGVKASMMENATVTFLWMCNFYLELAVIISFTLLASLIIKSAVLSALSCLAFYFLCRILGFFLIAIDSGAASLMYGGTLGKIAKYTFQGLNCIIPRFDMFAKAEWLVYGFPEFHTLFPFIQGALIYVCFDSNDVLH